MHNPDKSKNEDVLFDLMLLASTLSTISETEHSIRERRAGRQPSNQQPHNEAKAYLHQTIPEITQALLHLEAVHLSGNANQTKVVYLFRNFQALTYLRRLSNNLKGIHQRLLSLYPEVSDEIVEESRVLAQKSQQLNLKIEAERQMFFSSCWHFVSCIKKDVF